MTTTNHRDILKDIQKKIFYPIYILMGDESFFIDEIAKSLQDNILSEDEKVFDESIVYGKDVTIDSLMFIIKRFPAIAQKHLIIVRDAQSIKNLEKIEPFFEGNLESHIVVICHNEKSIDKRKKIFKLAESKGVIFESKKLYENTTHNWINEYCNSKNYTINPLSSTLLIEFLGLDLYRLKNELDKLFSIIKNRNSINLNDIETYVGISKEYNIFELQNAISERNETRVFKIIYSLDSKKNPLILILSSLNSHFQKIITYITEDNKNPQHISSKLGVNPYFLKNYETASRNFNIKNCINAIEYICSADRKLKGFGVSQIKEKDILKELMFNILR